MTFPWETLEPIVRDLYVTQDLKLDRVIEEVKAKHGYTIKSRTYREKFRTWKSRKSDYKEPKPKKSNQATRSQSRSSSPRVGARNSPRKNSPVSTRTSSTNTRGRALPAPVLWRDGPRHMSSNAQWSIYDDIESTHQNFEQSIYTSMEGTNANIGFQDKAESTESNLVPMGTGPPLTHQSLKELNSTQMNTRDSAGRPQFFQYAYPESTLPAQFGAPYMIQTPPNPVTPGPLQWPTCPSCNDRNYSVWEAGEFVPCNEMGCLCMGMRDMQAPSISYPMTAQIPTSDNTSTCPSLTWTSNQQETQSTNSVSDPAAEQNDFRVSAGGPELHYEDALSMECNERTENLSSLSCHLQPANDSSSLQSHQLYDMDNLHLSQVGSQMDASPRVRENYSLFLQDMQSQDTSNYSLQQGDESSWQVWYADNTQAMNTITPQVESHVPVLQENLEQAMTMVTPHARSYEFPLQNGFCLQDASMATANEGFGMYYQQNNAIKFADPFFAPLATSAQSTFDLSQNPSQSCGSRVDTFNNYYSPFVPENIHRHDSLGLDPTSEHRQW